jgi:hypothetical protein
MEEGRRNYGWVRTRYKNEDYGVTGPIYERADGSGEVMVDIVSDSPTENPFGDKCACTCVGELGRFVKPGFNPHIKEITRDPYVEMRIIKEREPARSGDGVPPRLIFPDDIDVDKVRALVKKHLPHLPKKAEQPKPEE